jgi:hypothetical protein
VIVTVVLTFWAPLTAVTVTVPEHPLAKVTVVVTLPLALVVPDGALNVAGQPATDHVTAWPAPPGKWALHVTVPPGACVVGAQDMLVPGVPV